MDGFHLTSSITFDHFLDGQREPELNLAIQILDRNSMGLRRRQLRPSCPQGANLRGADILRTVCKPRHIRLLPQECGKLAFMYRKAITLLPVIRCVTGHEYHPSRSKGARRRIAPA